MQCRFRTEAATVSSTSSMAYVQPAIGHWIDGMLYSVSREGEWHAQQEAQQEVRR